MKNRRTIAVIVGGLLAAVLYQSEKISAYTGIGAKWDYIPVMSMTLSANAPADAAGQSDPWHTEASFALFSWGESWLGNGNEVPGAAFTFNSIPTGADWCDHMTFGSNAVQWGLPDPNPLNLVTPCNGAKLFDAIAVTIKTDAFSWAPIRVFVNNADVLFNSNKQWTSAARSTLAEPLNFRSVAMHEFGHALGLDHEDDTLAVMNSRYHPNPGLHADDRLGLRTRYPGPGTETDIGPSFWKKTDGSSATSAVLVSSPAFAVGAQTITLEYTQENFGTTDATFNTGFFLSNGSPVSTSGILMGRNLGAFEQAGHSTTYTVNVTVPANTPPGTYAIGVCLDDDNVLAESREFNNCMTYPQSINITAPADLVVSALTGTSPVNAGSNMSVDETRANIGPGRASGAHFMAYSLLSVASPNAAPISLLPLRPLSPLDPGQNLNNIFTVYIPTNVVVGTYRFRACVDERNDIVETDETNNCTTAANTIQVTRLPDLQDVFVGDPPVNANVGDSFSVEDTVINLGVESAAASTVRYRLSLDTNINAGDVLLTGTRPVSLLGVNLISRDTVTVTIPQSVGFGTYYLAACADDGNSVAEINDTNNCAISAGQVSVTSPNLQVTSVTNPPASVAVGVAFLVSATTFNAGNGQAAASVTRYRLSTDASISRSDILVGTAGHAVPVLAANATSTGPQLNLRFPSTVATRTYYLGACSDDDLVIIETDESDNCLAAATTVLVTNPNIMSDLVSEPVDITPLTVGPGDKVTVTDTTKNIGSAPVGSATTTRYWMSIYSTVGSKPNLLGANALTRVVPDLAAGARSKVSTLVTIPATIPRGNYFIGACSDNSGAATESNETNNCRLVPITVQ